MSYAPMLSIIYSITIAVSG